MATFNEVQFVQTQHQGAKWHKNATYGHAVTCMQFYNLHVTEAVVTVVL